MSDPQTEFDLAELRARQEQARAETAARHRAAQDAAYAIVECPRCDDDGYTAALVVCDHQDHASTTAREAAMARIRQTLTKETR